MGSLYGTRILALTMGSLFVAYEPYRGAPFRVPIVDLLMSSLSCEYIIDDVTRAEIEETRIEREINQLV